MHHWLRGMDAHDSGKETFLVPLDLSNAFNTGGSSMKTAARLNSLKMECPSLSQRPLVKISQFSLNYQTWYSFMYAFSILSITVFCCLVFQIPGHDATFIK